MIKTLLSFLLMLTILACHATSPVSPEDQAILTRFFAHAQRNKLSRLPVNERVVAIGRFFIGTPYQGGTLDANTEERLVVNLRAFDCVTFVDNVLALALLDEYNEQSIASYLKNLQQIRYRNGKITDYSSRLHYSSDWLYEMTRVGWLTDVTRASGGIPFPNKVNFISNHYLKYPPLRQDTSLVSRVIRIETRVNKRHYYYLPKNQIFSHVKQIQAGDILLITTHTKGLDTSHVGIAIEEKGEIHLLHASTTTRQVSITRTPLPEYLQKNTLHSGIIIARAMKFNLN